MGMASFSVHLTLFDLDHHVAGMKRKGGAVKFRLIVNEATKDLEPD